MERMVQIPYRRGSVDTPHLFCLVEDGSNPRGVEMHRTTRIPLFWAREREREKEGSDAFPWGAWPRDAAVDTHK